MTDPLPPYRAHDLFCDPVRTGATLSPDGTLLAYLAPSGGRLNVWVEPVEGGPATCVTHDHERGIRSYRWTADPRWLLYLQDDRGDENWHLWRVDLEHPDEPAVDLTPFPGVTCRYELLAARPHCALVTMNLRRRDELDVHLLDLLTGELELVAQNPGDVADWVLGASGDVFAVTKDESGDETFSHWTPSGSRPLITFSGAENPLSVHPAQVTPSGDGLWLASNRGTEHTRLVHVSVEDGTETVLAEQPGLSLDELPGLVPTYPPTLVLSRDGSRLLAARFLGDRQVLHVLDPHFAQVHEALRGLSDGDLGAVSSDLSGTRWVVSFTSDTDPEVTWFYDHGTGEARRLFRPYPHLDPARLAPMRPVVVPSRDGLPLHSFLTLPVGVEPVDLPLVVLVHGGPWARDRWGWNPRVQFLAACGYAVLQVNMRGSTGYGKSFTRAAIGEFAGRMHDDLLDGRAWAVEQGIADPERTAIFGGSYGGYSALVAATFTPEVFAAAVDVCGISSLPSFLRTLGPQWRKFLASNWLLYVGDPDDPEQERDMLARSPVSRLDAVCRPLLVAQGGQDVRVVQAESDAVVEALRARGADVEYVLKADEGHGFFNPENNVDLYERVAAFLGRTIGAQRATAPAQQAV